jgi:hypothetical protein
MKMTPYRQDEDLIREARAIRSWGGVRLVVNPHGIVLTKVPPPNGYQGDEQAWLPVYLGRINKDFWFLKEECQ